MNLLYPKFAESLLTGQHNMLTHAIMASLIDLADYTYGPDDESYAEGSPDGGIPDIAKVAQTQLTEPTVAGGVFDSASCIWLAVTGDPCEAVVLWNDTPVTPIVDPLIALYDSNVLGLPVVPNGGNINCTVHTSGWFALRQAAGV